MDTTSLFEQLPNAIEDMEIGFHFEEGGCYAFAYAMAEALQVRGIDSEAVITPGEAHAYLKVDGAYIDHQGAFSSIRDPYTLIAIKELQEIAHKHQSIEEFWSDVAMAKEVIEEAMSRI